MRNSWDFRDIWQSIHVKQLRLTSFLLSDACNEVEPNLEWMQSGLPVISIFLSIKSNAGWHYKVNLGLDHIAFQVKILQIASKRKLEYIYMTLSGLPYLFSPCSRPLLLQAMCLIKILQFRTSHYLVTQVYLGSDLWVPMSVCLSLTPYFVDTPNHLNKGKNLTAQWKFLYKFSCSCIP